MKICWDNLNKIRYNKNTGLWYGPSGSRFKYVDSCLFCGKDFLSQVINDGIFCSNTCSNRFYNNKRKGIARGDIAGKNNFFYGKKRSNETKIKISNTKKKYNKVGKLAFAWKGGVKERNIPLFDTYAHKIDWIEEVRRDPENPDYLQVKCTESRCKNWFVPKTTDVQNRIGVLKGRSKGWCRFYCSKECKQNCSIFGQRIYPKGFINTDNIRHDQVSWAQLIKERDNFECQRCSSTENLIAHHIEGLNKNPLESADIDLGITLCIDCHKLAHKDEGCRFADMRKENICE